MKTPTPAQQLAITTSGNVLVVAGAGTGKTSTLVERCVSRLIDERCALDRILMVTFTDAAAAEMRHRIGEELQKRRAATQESELALHLDQQIALLDTAQISTLSSFCLQLVRDHFYELKLDPQLTVLDAAQTGPLMSNALDEIFETHYAGDSDEDEAVRRLIRTYGNGSDAPVRACVIKIHRYTQTLTNPRQWFATQWACYSTAEPDFWNAELCRFFGEWRSFWKSALESWRATVPAIDRCLRELHTIECPTAPQLAEVFRCVQTSIDDTKAWAGKKTKIPEAKKFIEEMGTLSNGVDSLAADWAAARPHMQALLKLAQEFSAKFAAAKRELGGVDFADVEQYALELLLGESRDQLSPVALSLREQFQHVFVDEYQDINEAQDKIIEAVSRRQTLENPGNRFLVGDVKQSIYRFRLADSKIFSRYHANWHDAGANGQSLPLSDNFRSREAILKFVNGFFTTLMRPAVGGVAYSEDAHLVFANANERQPLAQSTEDPRVELHLFSTASDDAETGTENINMSPEELVDLESVEREARLIAQRFAKLRESRHQVWCRKEGRLRAVEWSDMAVLMRSPKTRVETFAKEFHRAGVPLRAARAGFYDAAEVRDFIGLMQLLDNPLQDVPLVAVLRSPLAGMPDDELAEIRIASPHGPFWRAASDFRHRGAPRENANAIQAWQKLSAFMQQVESWRKFIRQSSLSRCLEVALVDTHYEAMLAADPRGAERMANVLRLIELARAYDPLQRQGLYRFLKFIEAQREVEVDHEPAPVAAGDAVQLMSIHKSKGLEFPIVALANIGGRFNERSLNESILVSETLGLCPKIFPDDLDVMYPSIAHWMARRNERRELWGEEMRLLYVALTRARDTLILVGTAPRRRDGERWESVASAAISDWALMNASCYFDWLRLWLQQNTTAEHWTSDRSGTSPLMRWNIYAPNDPVLATRAFASIEKANPAVIDERSASEVLKRVASTYPFADATREPAKTSLSALRHRMDADEEAFPWFRLLDVGSRSVSGRESGSAHHALLEVIPLDVAADVESLRAQAVELTGHGVMNSEQAAALDLEAIARFWQSPIARGILAHAAQVQRELPFTARFTPKELAAVGLSRFAEPEEFVVLQGVVDLAVLLENEIWVLDFKTDRVLAADASAKAEVYRPQLEIYAQALQRIYGRPVKRRWLHFLSCGETIEV
jgi:ATP-dependent helicase/nuclease subunit A